MREVATGCKDETAACHVLSELERRAELVKANVITASEDAIADHQQTPLSNHLEDYALTFHNDMAAYGDCCRGPIVFISQAERQRIASTWRAFSRI